MILQPDPLLEMEPDPLAADLLLARGAFDAAPGGLEARILARRPRGVRLSGAGGAGLVLSLLLGVGSGLAVAQTLPGPALDDATVVESLGEAFGEGV
jgi:hypothetical protein